MTRRKRATKKEAKKGKQPHLRTVDPISLNVEEGPDGVQLTMDGRPLRITGKDLLVHPRRSLIEHIKEEVLGYGTITVNRLRRVIEPRMITSYALLATQRELESNQSHSFVKDFKKWLILDPCLSRCAGPEVCAQIPRWSPLTRFYQQNDLVAPDFPQIPIELDRNENFASVLMKRSQEIEYGESAKSRARKRDSMGLSDPFYIKCNSFAEGIEKCFSALGNEERAVMLFLYRGHGVILFPLLLVSGLCNEQEYASGVMAARCELTTAFGDIDADSHAEMARNYREDAQICLRFLTHARCPWWTQIQNGENDTCEFKATLRYDLETQKHNKDLEHSVLKTLAGFMNGKGGVVFVGVADSGSIQGIERDGFKNNDKWSLHLVTRIGQQIGRRFVTKCRIEFDLLHGKTVARITVEPSNEPAYFDESPLKSKGAVKDAFYVRIGPSTQKFSPEEIAQYCATRFCSQNANQNQRT